jgi:hypothetical protein
VKTSRHVPFLVPFLVPLLTLVTLLSACSTTKVDWNSRIGTYTYDQALVDLGPPDKSAQLSDGGTVAEWLTRRGSSGSTMGMYYGRGYYPYYHGYYGFTPYYSAPSSDSFLRLTFGPDGKLQTWKKFSR